MPWYFALAIKYAPKVVQAIIDAAQPAPDPPAAPWSWKDVEHVRDQIDAGARSPQSFQRPKV